jgi:catechol 2,3-dioxygenase-like lactoylglutathione lyase family enzyme
LDTYDVEAGASRAKPLLPSRLHHNAYVTRDMDATRHFYEDVLGFPLVATWCEADELFGALRVYCHCFFAIGDGGALAFFQFADPQDQERFGPRMPFTPFHHIAFKVDAETQTQLERRVAAAGFEEPQTFVLEHGYCRSLYVTDPNGLIIELTRDAPDVTKINADRRADAHAELRRWLAGDHRSNNTYR